MNNETGSFPHSQLSKGYKLTDVGVIPEEWDAPFLGEIFTFKNGLNQRMHPDLESLNRER